MLALSFLATWIGTFIICLFVVVLVMGSAYMLTPFAAALYALLRPGRVPGGPAVPLRRQRPYISPELRLAVLERDGWRCQECGGREDLELDHEVPFIKGGATDYNNLRVLCAKCNEEKGAT